MLSSEVPIRTHSHNACITAAIQIRTGPTKAVAAPIRKSKERGGFKSKKNRAHGGALLHIFHTACRRAPWNVFSRIFRGVVCVREHINRSTLPLFLQTHYTCTVHKTEAAHKKGGGFDGLGEPCSVLSRGCLYHLRRFAGDREGKLPNFRKRGCDPRRPTLRGGWGLPSKMSTTAQNIGSAFLRSVTWR